MPKRNPVEEQRRAEVALALAEELGGLDAGSSKSAPRGTPSNVIAQAEASMPYIPLALGETPADAAAREEQQEARSSLWEGYGLWDAVKDSYSSESLIFATLSALQESGIRVDPEYRLPALDSDEWKQLTADIPEEWHDNFQNAVSRDHAQYLRQKILTELDTEQRLQEYAGIGGRLLLGVVNPESLLMAVGSGGLSWIQKGKTIANVAARAGVVGAAENLAVDIPLIAQQETRDYTDAAISATAGFILGGAFGSLSRYLTPPERDALVRAGRDEIAALQSELDSFGPDSGGAARLNKATGERLLADDSKLAPTVEVPLTTYDGARIGPLRDYAADIHSIPDPTLRNTVGPYTGDPAGSSNGRVVPIGADEEAHRIRDVKRSEYARSYERTYKAWADAKGYGFWRRMGMAARREFGDAVTLHRIGAVISEDPHVKKQAAFEDSYYEWFRAEAKAAGVKGFTALDGPPQGKAYRPRVWNKQQLSELSRAQRFGAGVIERLIARAFKTANPDVEDAVAERVGRAIAVKLRETHAGINDGVVLTRTADGEWLDEVLKEVDADDDLREYVKRLFTMKTAGRTEEGSLSHGKHRAVLDESVYIDAVDKLDGKVHRLHLWQLLINDAEQLADIYTHRMSGAIGFAKRANVKSRTDHQNNIRQVLSYYEAKGDVDTGKRVARALDEVYKLSHGMSLVGADEHPGVTAIRKAARSMRDLAFMVRMNMVWMSQLPDSASWLIGAQFKRLMRYMPNVGEMFRRMQDGTLEAKFAAEIERHTGLATEGQVNSAFSAFDDDMTSPSSRIAHAVRVGQRGTQAIGLIARFQNFNQRFYSIAYGTRLIDNALGKASDLSAQRLASAGLDAAMLKRIGEQARKFGTVQDHGKGVKIERLNTEDWEDRAAADAFWSAVSREGRRAVQEEVIGETPWWLNQWWGKVIGQFRRFGIVSHTKQFLFAVRHRDMEVMQRLAYSTVLSGMAYASQMYLYSLTKSPEEARKFREKYLSPGAIAWGAFSRAGMFAMMPALWQTAQNRLTDTDLVDTRVSGLSGDIIHGIPAVDLVMRSVAFLSDMAKNITRGDREFDRSDFRNLRAVTPYQNAPLVKQALDWFEQMLPEDDGDTNPDEVDWGFRG